MISALIAAFGLVGVCAEREARKGVHDVQYV